MRAPSAEISPPHIQALNLLYRNHHEWLAGWLHMKLGCPHHAADLAHDTFARVLASRDTLDWHEPRIFLTTIAKALVIDHYRRAELERVYLAELALLPEPLQSSTETQILELEALCELDRLLSELSEKARTAFLCNRLDGMAHADIAAQLGVSVLRVRQYLVQCMRQYYLARYRTPR